MLIKKILILFISYYLSNHLVIDRIHYDIEYFPIENFKQERYRCIRYINNNIFSNFLGTASGAANNNKIITYIKTYPNAKCIKYKKDYIDYIINKNKIIIYNTLIHTTFYIILMIF
jgi:hypothetical protein